MRRLAALVPALALAVLALPSAARADTCLGEACPYAASRSFGESGSGVLRFPQAVTVGPGGDVYVGDQSSHIVQVFNSSGQFVRQFGTPGLKPGQLTAISSIAVAPTGTAAVTDGGTDRVNFFNATGELIGTTGGSGTGVGQFRFGAGGGNDAPAGGAIAFKNGYLYISDSLNNRVQRMDLDGTGKRVLIDNGILSYPRGLTVAGDRLVVADDKNHRIAIFDLNGTFLQAVGLGQGASPGQLTNPFGVAVDYQGRMFIADDMNHRVVRFGGPPKYEYRARWGSYGTAPGQFGFPRAIATDPQSRVYVANTANDRIDVFDTNGNRLSTFGRSGRGPGQYNAPVGVGVDASGIRAVADSINGRVQLINPDGSLATIWGSPNPGPTILRRPVDVEFDGAGNGYVLDQSKSTIVVFDRATARSARRIGSYGTGPGQLLNPTAIARDTSDRLWVADAGNVRLARFSLSGSYLGSIPMTDVPRGIAISPDGSRVYVSTGRNRVEILDSEGKNLGHFGYGPGAKLGQLSAPSGLATDAAGTVWVADRSNNRVAHFDAGGKRLGTFGALGAGDGAQFNYPMGIAADCNGRLTVSDTRNNIVREFTLANPAVSPCVALPAPAQPPALQYPTLPAPDGPLITARALRTRFLLGSGVALRARCDTLCTLTASATLTQVGRPAKRKGASQRRVSIQLRPTVVRLAAGGSKALVLKPAATDAAKLRRALGRNRRVVASIVLSAVGDAGEPTSTSIEIQGTR